ncbi:MAG: hypothetical protein Q4B13_01295 [Lautropia sp.]|nr:hypothetical protein [Lautropia sp.]
MFLNRDDRHLRAASPGHGRKQLTAALAALIVPCAVGSAHATNLPHAHDHKTGAGEWHHGAHHHADSVSSSAGDQGSSKKTDSPSSTAGEENQSSAQTETASSSDSSTSGASSSADTRSDTATQSGTTESGGATPSGTAESGGTSQAGSATQSGTSESSGATSSGSATEGARGQAAGTDVAAADDKAQENTSAAGTDSSTTGSADSVSSSGSSSTGSSGRPTAQSNSQTTVQSQTSGATADQTQDQDASSPSNSKTEGQGQQEAQNQEQTQGQTAGATQDEEQASAGAAQAQTMGFVDHGVPTPVAQTRGVVSTVDQNGQDVVLTWLQDWRGGYSVLMINAETGASQQFEAPFKPEGDEPSALYLSSKNRLYTLFNNNFVEFDVASKRFTYYGKTEGKTAMSMTEDKNGQIWAATYPNNQLVSFNPSNSSLHDHGQLAKESWAQYPRSIAADGHGWVYVGTGLAASQIYAYNVSSSSIRALLPTTQRISGAAVVGQSESNAVYATNGQQKFMLAEGKASGLGSKDEIAASNLKAGAQNMVDRDFPSGRRLISMDMHDRLLVTRNAAGQEKTVRFTYNTQGAALTFVCVSGGNRVCGGTRFPMHTFYFNSNDNKFDSSQIPRQPNVMVALGSQMYVAAYPDGKLLQEEAAGKNEFKEVLSAYPSINRPHAMVILKGGKQIVLAGTPEYGMTGGGMLFWNRENGQKSAIDHWHLVPNHSVQALIQLSNGMLLGGTTVAPGTGGVTKATDSGELFLMDPNTHQVSWRGSPVPGARTITDLVAGPNGLIYGLADSVDLFAFNPNTHQVVSVSRFARDLGPSIFAQGTRAFVRTDDGSLYVLLYNGIGKVDTKTHTVSRAVSSPVRITVGGASAGSRIYFGSNNHLYSWQAK